MEIQNSLFKFLCNYNLFFLVTHKKKIINKTVAKKDKKLSKTDCSKHHQKKSGKVKNPPANARDMVSISGSGRSPTEGNGTHSNSYWENLIDRGD